MFEPTTIRLDKQFVQNIMQYSDEFALTASNLELTQWQELALEKTIYQLRYWFLQQEKTEYVCPPLTWWDHFKDTYRARWWFPRWIKPPVYDRVLVKQVRICPHMDAQIGDNKPHLEFFICNGLDTHRV